MTSPGGDFNVTSASGDDLPVFAAQCPITGYPIQVGGRWGAMILLCLRARPRRFGVLRRHLSPVSAKVLAETLQSMERDGFILRRPAAGTRDRAVEYALSELGHSLLPVIDHARRWGLAHLGELDEHRDNHDQASEAGKAGLDTVVARTPGGQQRASDHKGWNHQGRRGLPETGQRGHLPGGAARTGAVRSGRMPD